MLLTITQVKATSQLSIKACDEIYNYDTDKCETYAEQVVTTDPKWVEFQ